MKKSNIILIGFMGSGKTSVGKLLSKQLNFDFKDTDEMIETLEYTTIKDIFKKHGEEFFRDLETTLLLSIKDTMKRTVLSTGGGMPIRERNRKLLKEMGQVVYLKTSASTVVERVSKDNTRPLLKTGDLNETVERLLNKRIPYYEEAADIIIETDNKTVEAIVNEIEKSISG